MSNNITTVIESTVADTKSLTLLRVTNNKIKYKVLLNDRILYSGPYIDKAIVVYEKNKDKL